MENIRNLKIGGVNISEKIKKGEFEAYRELKKLKKAKKLEKLKKNRKIWIA